MWSFIIDYDYHISSSLYKTATLDKDRRSSTDLDAAHKEKMESKRQTRAANFA